MSAEHARTYGYYTAAHWFQGAVIFLLVSALALWLLSALNDAKERAERLSVELTIRQMRSGMHFAMGEALIRQSARLINSWEGSDPVRWLDSPPSGYRGECSAAERQALSGGEWCFDRKRRELVYRPKSQECLRDLGVSPATPCAELSWRVRRSAGSPASDGFTGLRIEAASACQWLLPGS